jgi:hypothetical protein
MSKKKDNKPKKKQDKDPAKKRDVEPGRQIPVPPKRKHTLEDPEVDPDHIISKKNQVDTFGSHGISKDVPGHHDI